MTIQRRTFLGGLLAAVAASAVSSRGLVTTDVLAAAEKTLEEKIAQVFPEPEEGYSLFITPGYDLPTMTASHSISVEFEHYPPVTIQGFDWHPPGYRSMQVNVEVRDEHAETMLLWFKKMMGDLNRGAFILDSVQEKDYNGVATFGPADKPIVKLEGLWPKQINFDYDTDKKTGKQIMIARAVMNFDYVHQNIL